MSLPVATSPWDREVARLAGIPIHVSPWVLLLVLYVVSRAQSLSSALVEVAALLISVFVHELGHAWEAKRQRLKPSIVIHGMGGYCSHQQAHSADGAFRVTAAGPAAGFVLAVVAFVLSRLLTTTPLFDQFLQMLWVLGAFWTVVNLLPVQPLDGGSLALNVARRFPSFKRAEFWMGVVGVQVALLLAVLGSVLGQSLLSILGLVFAFENAGRLGWVTPLQTLLGDGFQPDARGRIDRTVGGLLLGVGLLGVRGAASVLAPPSVTLALSWPDLHVWQLATQLVALDGPLMFDALVSLMAGQLFWRVAERRGARHVALVVVLSAVLVLPVALLLALVGAEGTGSAVVGSGLAVLVLERLLAARPSRSRGLAWEWALPALVLLVAVVAYRLLSPTPQRAVLDVVAASGGLIWPLALVQWRRLHTWWKLRDPPSIDIH